MNRFEFFEAIVRVAGCKYKTSGIVRTYAQALQMLLQQIRTHYQV